MFSKDNITLDKIVSSYKNNPRDVKTNPINNKEAVWFYVYVDNDNIYIENAINHSKSSVIKSRRRLDVNNFDTMLLINERRNNGEKVSKEAGSITVNQVYWYGIFADVK